MTMSEKHPTIRTGDVDEEQKIELGRQPEEMQLLRRGLTAERAV